MTRINSAINPVFLTDEHLLAEHREIKRLVFNYLTRKKNYNDLGKIPDKFCLGTGHVSFFLDKGKFTYERYKQLYYECLKRNFNVENFENNWDSYLKQHFNDYESTVEEYKLLRDRITERLLGSKKKNWHYYGEPISKEKSVEILGGINNVESK
jgi:deoxyribonuclease (pyrimidine dimer)